MIMQLAKISLGLLFLLSAIDAVVHAQSCGGTITGTVTLTADLACPTGHGLLVGSGATLDCAGHTISGGEQPGYYGIYLRNVSNAIVQNCIVEHFEMGMRLRSASDCTVQDSTLQHNTRYGMELSGSVRATIQRNTVYNNSDEGIHVSGPTGDAAHRIVGNTLSNNAIEGIYLITSHANVISGNTTQNQATAGIYVKGSDRNRIEGNTLTNDAIHIMSGSEFNILTDNTIIGDRLKLSGVSHNQVERMTVQGQGGRPSNAYDFTNSSNNTVVDSQALDPDDFAIRATNGSKTNTFTRFLATPSLRCYVDRTSSVTITNPAGTSVPCRR